MASTNTRTRTPKSVRQSRAAKMHALILAWSELLRDLEDMEAETPDDIMREADSGASIRDARGAIRDLQVQLCFAYLDEVTPHRRERGQSAIANLLAGLRDETPDEAERN